MSKRDQSEKQFPELNEWLCKLERPGDPFGEILPGNAPKELKNEAEVRAISDRLVWDSKNKELTKKVWELGQAVGGNQFVVRDGEVLLVGPVLVGVPRERDKSFVLLIRWLDMTGLGNSGKCKAPDEKRPLKVHSVAVVPPPLSKNEPRDYDLGADVQSYEQFAIPAPLYLKKLVPGKEVYNNSLVKASLWQVPTIDGQWLSLVKMFQLRSGCLTSEIYSRFQFKPRVFEEEANVRFALVLDGSRSCLKTSQPPPILIVDELPARSNNPRGRIVLPREINSEDSDSWPRSRSASPVRDKSSSKRQAKLEQLMLRVRVLSQELLLAEKDLEKAIMEGK
jgi:hypothetical protein